MAAPNVVTVVPAPGATGIVLGAPLTITFDSLIDHSTLTTATFAVTCQGESDIVTPEQYLAAHPRTMAGQQFQGSLAGQDKNSFTRGRRRDIYRHRQEPLADGRVAPRCNRLRR